MRLIVFRVGQGLTGGVHDPHGAHDGRQRDHAAEASSPIGHHHLRPVTATLGPAGRPVHRRLADGQLRLGMEFLHQPFSRRGHVRGHRLLGRGPETGSSWICSRAATGWGMLLYGHRPGQLHHDAGGRASARTGSAIRSSVIAASSRRSSSRLLSSSNSIRAKPFVNLRLLASRNLGVRRQSWPSILRHGIVRHGVPHPALSRRGAGIQPVPDRCRP